MKKAMQVLTAVLFCGFIGGFGLLHILLPDQTFSPVENRSLSQFPDFSWEKLRSGEFTEAVETYLEDQFPLRDKWIGIKSRYEYLLGKREFADVYLCGDTLISKVTESERAEKNLTYLQKLVEKTEIPVYAGLIPTAAEIWRDKLPAGGETMDQAAYLEQVKETGAHYVDVAGMLAAHADEAIYYRTDHHWTSLGAYYGYAALMETLGVEPEPLGDKTTVSDSFLGTLYSSSGVHWLEPDDIDIYVPGDSATVTVNDGVNVTTHGLYVEQFLDGKDKYSFFMGGNNPLYVIENADAATDRKLLVLRDSYADALAPFLSRYYAEIHMVDLRYYRVPVAAYAQMMGADEILVAYSVDNFQKDDSIIFMGQ